MTNDEAAALWEASGAPFAIARHDHLWAEWGLNYDGSAEYRLCARCGDMEQQWISS